MVLQADDRRRELNVFKLARFRPEFELEVMRPADGLGGPLEPFLLLRRTPQV